MTVCGLSPVLLSTITGWQQTILFLLMAIGNITFVSWLMVYVRKAFFKRHCEGVLNALQIRQPASEEQHSLSQSKTTSNIPSQDLQAQFKQRRSHTTYQANSSNISPHFVHQSHTIHTTIQRPLKTDLGGFPIFSLITSLISRISPERSKKLKRSLTISQGVELKADERSWLDFDLPTGRNSRFHLEGLSDEQVEAIGGVEYAALNAWLWILPLVRHSLLFTICGLIALVEQYFVLVHAFAYVTLLPWLYSKSKYEVLFTSQARYVPKSWVSCFYSCDDKAELMDSSWSFLSPLPILVRG